MMKRSKIGIGLLAVLATSLLTSPASSQGTPDSTQTARAVQRPSSDVSDSALSTEHSSLADSVSHQPTWKAVVLSLMVPGLGEAYAGSWDRARVFFATEGAVWAGFTAFRIFSHWRANDYRVYAAEHTGIDPDGKPDSYFRDIGGYSSSAVYNEQQQLIHREGARLYTAGFAWEWDNNASRKTYLAIRRSSERARVRSTYTIGVALINRLVSAVDAVKAVDTRRRKVDPGPSFDLIAPPDGSVWVVARVAFN